MQKRRRDKYHLLQKFTNREITGSFVSNLTLHSRSSSAYHLFPEIPQRCIHKLSDVIKPMKRHVFMGMTKCGRFLVTYSASLISSGGQKYRLHWWLYSGCPRSPATKVAEVQLFSDQPINNIQTIGVAQWPNIHDRLIIYGYCDFDHVVSQEEGVDGGTYYVTVTTLPSTGGCKDCRTVAASFNEEDMAANWDSCVGLTCLKHGLTVHTSFDVSAPFPTFEACLDLKQDNKIVFNSGNLLHCISLEIEKNCDKSSASSQTRSNADQPNIVNDLCINHRVGEMLCTGSNFNKKYHLPWNVERAYQIGQTISNLPSSEGNLQRAREERRQWCAKIPNLAMKPVPNRTKAWRRTISDQAEKVYAFEEVEEVGCEPMFKWYRRRRLADKMYEFCSDDEDVRGDRVSEDNENVENIRPEQQQKTEIDDDDMVGNTGVASLDSIQQPFTLMAINHGGKVMLLQRVSERKSESHEDHLHQRSVSDSNTMNQEDWSRASEDRTDLTTSGANLGDTTPSLPELGQLSVKTDCDSVSVTSRIVSQDLKAIIADWEADSVSSLSPKSDAISSTSNFIEFSSFPSLNSMSNLNLNLTLNSGNSNRHATIQEFLRIPSRVEKRSSEFVCSTSEINLPSTARNNKEDHKFPRIKVVLRPRNRIRPLTVGGGMGERSSLIGSRKRHLPEEGCCQNKSRPSQVEGLNDGVIEGTTVDKECTSDEKIANRLNQSIKIKEQLDQAFGRQLIGNCSVQLDRRFIEVDEEMVSTITDIEDDDEEIGFHCALPLMVHGSAYSQMQMVSNSKAGKLNVPCVLVRQKSLDIEQFCYKAAENICKCEGFKFWFCSDYDTEIVSVCPLNGDILVLAFMRLNAEQIRSGAVHSQQNNRRKKPRVMDPRHYYECSCLFVWNTERNDCWLEAYTRLKGVQKGITKAAASFALGHGEAERLRSRTIGLFGPPNIYKPPVRNLVHLVYDDEYNLAKSADQVVDLTNVIVIQLRRKKVDKRRVIVLQ